jgi:hypothetical protein
MAQVLHSLNDEWATIADSPMARRALMRWSDVHPVLLPAGNLAEVIELGYRPDIGPEIRRALALMAPEDHLAARTLLQELLGGLVNLAHRVGRDDDAVDDVIGLAWERICTYPGHRPGTVSGNVLLDVRKRYRREQDKERQSDRFVSRQSEAPSAEERVRQHASFIEELDRGEPVHCPGSVERGPRHDPAQQGRWRVNGRSSPPSSTCRSKCSGIAGGGPRPVFATFQLAS